MGRLYSGLKKTTLVLTRVFSLFPLKYIVFESTPDYAENTRAVFDEMVKRGLNMRYKFVWLCKNKNTSIPFAGVICAYSRTSQLYYRLRAKFIISCNWFVPALGNYQKSLYLCHGVPIKSLNGYKAPTDGLDYAAGLSSQTNEIQSRELNLPIEKFISFGYPRNDALSQKTHDNIADLFGGNYSKIIVWYPTYRQHGYSKLGSESSHALPIIYDEKCALRINNFAKRKSILIVLKPHFSQDTSYIKELSLSNIVFIDDKFFSDHNLSSYEFVGGCDALITDYSSIYFDYLLVDKPIAAIWEDIEEYRKNRGFAIDPDYYMKGAYKVYNEEDFISFLEEVASGRDSMKEQRKDIIGVIHEHPDFQSTKRVVDFIEKALQ